MQRWQLVGATSLALACSVGAALPAAAAEAGHGVAAGQSGLVGLIANPNVAFVLLLVALLGVGLEVLHPGAVVFGSIGVLAGVVAAIGLFNLDVNVSGLVLVAAAAALLVVDTSGHSHGVLSVAGTAAAVAGGLLLFGGPGSASGVNLAALLIVPVGWAAVWVTLSRRALKVRHLPFASSSHELLGLSGVVRQGGAEAGIAAVEGELWRVVSLDGQPLRAGQRVTVMAEDGLTLVVEPASVDVSAAGLPDPTKADSQRSRT